MRRAIALTACLAAGVFAALAVTRPAHAGLDCTTDTAATIASAVVKDLGNSWSAPGQGDLWDVDMSSINADVSVYAVDAADARVVAKTWIDNQLASMGCGVTTTTTQTTTTAPAVTTAPPAPVTTTVVSTQTQTTTQTVATPGVVVFVPQAPQTVTSTTVATVTTPAPKPKVVTVKAKPVVCKSAKKPTKKGAR